MRNIQVLDVTLRDGGCVNDFNFGTSYMEKIKTAQELSGIDIVEVGYIDEKNGSEIGRTKFVNEKVIGTSFLKYKSSKTTYVAMMDYGKFDTSRLSDFDGNGIDGIRLAFHKKNYRDIVGVGRHIIEKGYKLFVQPMLTLRYSDEELLDLINLVNSELSETSAFYIVDSFGEMHPDDLEKILDLVDRHLKPQIHLGLHSHNNLQLSYSNACTFIEFDSERDIIIDSSVMGMGKGAGNLNTELLIGFLNRKYNKQYKIEPLLDLIDKVINQLYEEYKWGYSIEYYLSSVNHCSPTYAGYYYNKHMLSVDKVNELLSKIVDDKKISFDKEYADKLYQAYNEEYNINDDLAFEKLSQSIKGKKILLVAPGKSVLGAMELIDELLNNSEYISIGINSTLDRCFDYDLITREDIYDEFQDKRSNIIALSNLVRETTDNVLLLNYKDWIEIDNGIHDSSTVIIMRLLEKCGAEDISLIGFDGFSVNINENYYDPNLRHPVSINQQEQDNNYFRSLFSRIRERGISLHFLTESIYE